jgi:hypothetical protein
VGKRWQVLLGYKEDFKENTAVRTTQEPASHFKHEKNKFKD